MSINQKVSRMRYKRLKLSIVLLLGLGLTGLQAQESVNTTGGNASGNGGSVSYSIGQLVNQSHTGTNGSVAEGLQQPYQISVVKAIEESEVIKLSVIAYPNPTTNYLTLTINEFDLSNLVYQLYDMNGNLLQSQRITKTNTRILMDKLAPASYFVKIIQKNKEVKTFKIIKN